MDFSRAFVAGVIGGLVISIVLFLARTGGLTELNIEIVLGSLVTQVINRLSWGTGFLMHLVISGLIAVLYAFGFEYLTQRASWRIGVGFAVAHVIIAGLVMGALGTMHPLMVPPPPPPPEGQLLTPGVFAVNFGAVTAAAFIVLHLIYGSIVGAMYRVTHLRLVHAKA